MAAEVPAVPPAVPQERVSQVVEELIKEGHLHFPQYCIDVYRTDVVPISGAAWGKAVEDWTYKLLWMRPIRQWEVDSDDDGEAPGAAGSPYRQMARAVASASLRVLQGILHTKAMKAGHDGLDSTFCRAGALVKFPTLVAEVMASIGPWKSTYYFQRPWRYIPVLHRGEGRDFGYEHYTDVGGAGLVSNVSYLLPSRTVATDEPSSPWWLLRRRVREDGESQVLSPFVTEEVTDAHSRLVPHWFDEPLTEGVEWRLTTPWLLFGREPKVEDFPPELKADWPTGMFCIDEVKVEQCEDGGEEDFGKDIVVALRNAAGEGEGDGEGNAKGKGKRARGQEGRSAAAEGGRYKARLVRSFYDHGASVLHKTMVEHLWCRAAMVPKPTDSEEPSYGYVPPR
jgi:hypothetical protein